MISKITGTFMVSLLTIFISPLLLPKGVDIKGERASIELNVSFEKQRMDSLYIKLINTIE